MKKLVGLNRSARPFPQTPSPRRPGEFFGLVYGLFLGAVTAGVSAARKARTFHPSGIVYTGQATATTAFSVLHCDTMTENTVTEERTSIVSELVNRISGPILVRLSTALWKNDREWTDVLGIAVRFGGNSARDWTAEAQPGDQDLLFATVKHPSLLFISPFLTKVHDFFQNYFYAVSPFSLGEVKREEVYFRLCPQQGSSMENASRTGKVDKRVNEGTAIFTLEIQFQLDSDKKWRPCAELKLVQRSELNQEALRFSPFRDGKEIHPRGWIHFLRVGAYRGSQSTRPKV